MRYLLKQLKDSVFLLLFIMSGFVSVSQTHLKVLYNSKGIIHGANSQIFTPINSDLYYVIVSTAGCFNSLASNSITIVFAGIETLENIGGIQVFPNPARNELTLICKNSIEIKDFEILNSVGQVVYKSTLIDKKVVPIAFIPDGTYFIKFHFAQSVVVKKFVKNSQRI